MSHLVENLEIVRLRVDAAAAQAGTRPQLLVVSKTWSTEMVGEIVKAGQTMFGENRLQEGEDKILALPSDLEWHFIGGLQRNKVRRVLTLFPVIHSISSLKLAKYAARIAGELSLKPRVFLEVNIGAEVSKEGFLPDELRHDLEKIVSLDHLDVQGLMCIPPQVDSPELARPWFVKVRELQEEMQKRSGSGFHELSMGMSSDFEIAIEEGSTIVRLGSAIFGPRLKQA